MQVELDFTYTPPHINTLFIGTQQYPKPESYRTISNGCVSAAFLLYPCALLCCVGRISVKGVEHKLEHTFHLYTVRTLASREANCSSDIHRWATHTIKRLVSLVKDHSVRCIYVGTAATIVFML